MNTKITIGTGLIIINDNREVLLVKERNEKLGGKSNAWGIVGGKLEPDLTLKENAVKEALEETGYAIEIKSIVKIYQHIDAKYNRISFIYLAAPVTQKGVPLPEEINEIRWFNYENIPFNELRFSHNIEMIKDAYELYFSKNLRNSIVKSCK